MLRSTPGILARRAASVLTNTYSIDTDGTNDYVDCGNVTATNGVSNASWSMWFKLDSVSINQMAVSQWVQSCYISTYLSHSI